MSSKDNNLTNEYPKGIAITNPKNPNFRFVKIIVKEVNDFKAGIDTLKNKASEAYNDVKDIITTLGKEKAITKKKDAKKSILALNNTKTVWGVALPLPNELSETQSHDWETTSGIIGTTLGGLADTEIALGVSTNKAIASYANDSGMRKPLINPGYFQDYKGTMPREFTLSWDLIPNNAEEAESIRTIIYKLKKYSLPTSTINGLSLLSPYIFDIDFSNEHINNVINMTHVVCKELSVNYSVDNSMQMFDDGMPKYISLSMTFAERMTVTSEFY